jgi:hypothetical protein
MKNKYVNIFLITSILLLVVSCSTLKVEYAHRRIVYPGISSGKTKMSYEIGFSANNNFSINEIKLENSVIERYSIQNQQTKAFVDVKKNDFSAGKYKLFFSSFDIYKKGENNRLIIKVNQKNKNKIISVIVQDKEPIRKR